MPIDPQAARLMAMLDAGRATDWRRVTADERRQGFAALMRMAGAAPAIGGSDDITVRGAAGPLAARLYRPAQEPAGAWPGLVYFHGGGLVAGDLDTHDVLCRSLVAGSGCRVVAVAYRRPPEHRFPAAVEDAVAALADVLDGAEALGLDPGRVAVGGDSAGATLAAVAAEDTKRRDGRRPALQLLLCPVLDMEPATASRRAFARGHLLDADMMARDLADYAPEAADLADPRLSPLHGADLAGQPAVLIHTAEFDPLCDEGALYAGRLAAAGVPVVHRYHGGMIHHFYGLTGFIPAARVVLAEIAHDLGVALASAPSTEAGIPPA